MAGRIEARVTVFRVGHVEKESPVPTYYKISRDGAMVRRERQGGITLVHSRRQDDQGERRSSLSGEIPAYPRYR